MASLVLLLGVVLLATTAKRQASSSASLSVLSLVAGVALAARVVAVAIVYLIAIRTHGEGTWLNDEASYYLATESLLSDPFNRSLPQGLDHLAGNGYLGLTTAIALALGGMDTVAFRLANAVLGAFVALLAALVAARYLGRAAALVAGLGLAVWPTLILWSATMLRDTLVAFAAAAVWATLALQPRASAARLACVAVLGISLLAGLRPYLAVAAALGVGLWAIWPLLARQSRRSLALGAAGLLIVGTAAGVQQWPRVDQFAHELLFRQTVTRIETLGRLYHERDPNAPRTEPPFGPNAAVALIEPKTGWLLTGVVQQPAGPGLVIVAFVDDTVRTQPTRDLVLLQSAPLAPLQMLANLGPGLFTFLTGIGTASDVSSPAWIADAVAWDFLVALAVLGGLRARIGPREWILPVCLVVSTAAALVCVPGAPGNDDRHRATQTLPLLLVFACGLLSRRAARGSAAGPGPVTTPSSSPAAPPSPASSRMRSAR